MSQQRHIAPEDLRSEVTDVSETDKDYKLNQISQELKDKMIDDIRNGVEYKHFTVKEFKNGKAQLIRKKANVQTKDGKKSKQQDDEGAIAPAASAVPILDHLAKIHETIVTLKTKNKKRKKQIEEIYSLFGGIDEDEEEHIKKPAKKEQTVIEEEPIKELVTKKQTVIEEESKPVKKDLKTSLRSRLKWLS